MRSNNLPQSLSHQALKLLPKSFYARDARLVAPDLLGKLIGYGDVLVRITETESYFWPNDSANHGFRGKTERNASMFGPPGHAYVYLCYGLHHLLNFVTNTEGEAAAVLIRSCEPVLGHDLIHLRRKYLSPKDLLTGPGKICQALALDRSFCHQPLYESAGLCVFDAPKVKPIISGPRIGIDYASEEDRQGHYRFADADSSSVTKKAFLYENN